MKKLSLLCIILALIIPLTTFTAIMVEPNDRETYYFSSYAELNEALTLSDSEVFKQIREEETKYDYGGELYQKMLSAFENGDISLMIPMINREAMSFRVSNNKNSPILLFTREFLGLPWIAYRCAYKNTSLLVDSCYYSVLDNEELKSATSYRDVYDVLAPNATLPETFVKGESSLTAVYEKNVRLEDGTEVLALFYEYSNQTRIKAWFCYKDILINLETEKELFTDDLWNSFSIDYLDSYAKKPEPIPSETDITPVEPEDEGISPWVWVAVVSGSVAVVGAAVLAAVIIPRRKKRKNSTA